MSKLFHSQSSLIRMVGGRHHLSAGVPCVRDNDNDDCLIRNVLKCTENHPFDGKPSDSNGTKHHRTTCARKFRMDSKWIRLRYTMRRMAQSFVHVRAMAKHMRIFTKRTIRLLRYSCLLNSARPRTEMCTDNVCSLLQHRFFVVRISKYILELYLTMFRVNRTDRERNL